MTHLLSTFAALTLATLIAAAPAHAEGKLRIAEQFGVVYLLLNVAQDQKLIEKHGLKNGVKIDVDWIKLSGGGAVNDALLSGSIDIAGAGVGPLLTIWDRTAGRQNVKGVASLGNFPYYLVSTNPKVKTIADFTDVDRIALPASTVSVQARILQMAAAKQWGIGEFKRLDRLTQSIPHADAAAAVIAGQTEINAHLTYRALVDALAEAAASIANNAAAAVDSYLRVNKSSIDRAFLLKVIRNPQVEFKVAPQNTLGMGQFMFKAGALNNQPKSWRDYFFDHPALAAGS